MHCKEYITSSGKYIFSKFLHTSSNNLGIFGLVPTNSLAKDNCSHKIINSLIISISSPFFNFWRDLAIKSPELYGILFELNKNEGGIIAFGLKLLLKALLFIGVEFVLDGGRGSIFFNKLIIQIYFI